MRIINKFLIASCICAFFIWVIIETARQRENARTTDCIGNLVRIGYLLHEYHEKYKAFPPAYVSDSQGKPLHSWRVLVLEFLDPHLYSQYNFKEPWDGPNNCKLANKRPRCYSCPNAEDAETGTRTSYVVLVGPGTVFPGSKVTKFEDVTNDRNQTILVVEAENLNIHWMEPRDWDVESMEFVINDPLRPSFSSRDRKGPGVCFVNCRFERLRPNLSKNEFETMSKIAGKKK